MNEKKNIDRLFQEKFKDFEVAPNDAVWERISESLPKKKKKRRVIALWWQIGGVAAALALLLTVGVSLFNSEEHNNEDFPVTNTDNEDTVSKKDNTKSLNNKKQKELNAAEDDNSKIVGSDLDSEEKSNREASDNNNLPKTIPSNQLTTPNKSNQNRNTLANRTKAEQKTENSTKSSQKRNNLTPASNKDNSAIVEIKTKSNPTLKTDNTAQLKSEVKSKSVIKEEVAENKTVVAENNTTTKLDSNTINSDPKKIDARVDENAIVENLEKESIENAIAENEEKIEEDIEDGQNRWSIAPNVAPVYFNSFGNGSSLDKQFNENSKSADVSMSYGVVGSYAISKKLNIRTGINRVNLNQTTSDVFAFSGAETAARGIDAQFNNISFKDNMQSVSLMSVKMMNRASTPELFNTKIAGNIDQRFGFIEVPVELEYRLLDKKFGVNVIGGFSTFLLSENEIYADINGTSTLIGEANNINNTSFSANFGLGMDYSLSKQWNINLEPTFKYQINTFNNTTGDFKPFFIGVYTGLSYKF